MIEVRPRCEWYCREGNRNAKAAHDVPVRCPRPSSTFKSVGCSDHPCDRPKAQTVRQLRPGRAALPRSSHEHARSQGPVTRPCCRSSGCELQGAATRLSTLSRACQRGGSPVSDPCPLRVISGRPECPISEFVRQKFAASHNRFHTDVHGLRSRGPRCSSHQSGFDQLAILSEVFNKRSPPGSIAPESDSFAAVLRALC
jgi:hypothetical protein